MSLKSLIQVIIILIIIIILGGVYFNYFANNNKISLENNEKNIQTEIDTNKPKKKEKKNLPEESSVKAEINVGEEVKEVKSEEVKEVKSEEVKEVKSEEVKEVKSENVNLKKKIKPNKPEIDNIVKDIEYLTTDKNGNKYKILATSGRTNSEDKNILDLDNVRGVITSNKISTVYIVSDFAEYNSSELNSNFYQNVVINYEDKEITCDYFNVDMKTNFATAYNNVVVTDPKSIMKAGKIILNIETKDININPDNNKNKVKVTIN
jgi:LPS export ABC transporter protein LptC